MRSFLIEQTLFQSKSRCVLYASQCNSRITIKPFANKGGYLNACLHLTRSINIEYIVKTVNKKKKKGNKEREQKAMRSSLSKSNCRKAKKKKKEDLAMDWVARSQIRWAKDIAAASCHRNDCLIESSMAILLSFFGCIFYLALHRDCILQECPTSSLPFFLLFTHPAPKTKQKNTNGNRYFIALFLYIQSFWGGKATLNVNKCRHPPI